MRHVVARGGSQFASRKPPRADEQIVQEVLTQRVLLHYTRVYPSLHGDIQKQTEMDRERQRHTETDRNRQRQTEADRQRRWRTRFISYVSTRLAQMTNGFGKDRRAHASYGAVTPSLESRLVHP